MRDAIIAINAIVLYIAAMASLTIRQLDDRVKERLRIRAAQAGRSMEEEARTILTREMGGYLDGPGLLAFMQSLFSDEHEELEIPERNREWPPVDFSE